MGDAIAIVNYKWKSYICDTSTDPMGVGIINSIDIKIGRHHAIVSVYVDTPQLHLDSKLLRSPPLLNATNFYIGLALENRTN
jgi:hypothetical protein